MSHSLHWPEGPRDDFADAGRDSTRSARLAYLQCRHCGHEFSLAAPGTRHRNHCPHCLWSVHLDDTPGDRASLCRGGMEPIAIAVDPRGEWQVLHRCGTCHTSHVNRVAGDDDERTLLGLALRPLTRLPFPV